MVAIIDLERGIPSKRESPARVDYVPALCTHPRRYYRLDGLMKTLDLCGAVFAGRVGWGEVV